MSVDRGALLGALGRAQQLTADAVAANPTSQLFGGIANQLRAIRQDVERGGPFDPSIQARVTLGVLAVREFEQTDPEYADLLHEINFQYRYEGVVR